MRMRLHLGPPPTSLRFVAAALLAHTKGGDARRAGATPTRAFRSTSFIGESKQKWMQVEWALVLLVWREREWRSLVAAPEPRTRPRVTPTGERTGDERARPIDSHCVHLTIGLGGARSLSRTVGAARRGGGARAGAPARERLNGTMTLNESDT